MASFYYTGLQKGLMLLFMYCSCVSSFGAFNIDSRTALTKSKFDARCQALSQVTVGCRNLWTYFAGNFSCPADRCDEKIADNSYKNFIKGQPPVTDRNKVLFYSGKTHESAKTYAKCNDKTIIEETILGKILDGYEWCCVKNGEVISSCPEDSDCQIRTTNTFWQFLSAEFAGRAFGETGAILNGWNKDYTPYGTSSYFATHEVPYLRGDEVDIMIVTLVYEGNEKYWNCNSDGSNLDVLQDTLRKEHIEYKCEEEERKEELNANNYLVDCSDATTQQSFRFTAILLSTMLVMLGNSLLVLI